MDIQYVSQVLAANSVYFTLAFLILSIILLIFIISLWRSFHTMKKRYRSMMTGSEGANLEKLLTSQMAEVDRVIAKNDEILLEHQQIRDLLGMSITRIGVVRFRAFDDMGGDLSFAVALLNSHNDGIVLASIFGRDNSRTYVKPIENGTSTYPLTAEETHALQQAMGMMPKTSEVEVEEES